MPDLARSAFLRTSKFVYRSLLRPLIFTQDAQSAHATALRVMAYFDERPALLKTLHRAAFKSHPVEVGGVTLESPFILAAGMVKGHGFAGEAEALAAVESGKNIIPGWRSLPTLLGAVEFGSYTRHPRLGNPGTVIWRDSATRSTQNRVGLKNPGAAAAARFLAEKPLPDVYGINIAVSPGVPDPQQEICEVEEAVQFFLTRALRPSWLTLNISCPNTEDDPGDHQTESRTRALCRSLVSVLKNTPLWVKISPDLSESQYHTLLRVFADEGVRAVVATNTLAQPSPDNLSVMAGIGGGKLHARALQVVSLLAQAKRTHGYSVDIIGCGGGLDVPTARAFLKEGAAAVQYLSALIYSGPFAAAYMLADL